MHTVSQDIGGREASEVGKEGGREGRREGEKEDHQPSDHRLKEERELGPSDHRREGGRYIILCASFSCSHVTASAHSH